MQNVRKAQVQLFQIECDCCRRPAQRASNSGASDVKGSRRPREAHAARARIRRLSSISRMACRAPAESPGPRSGRSAPPAPPPLPAPPLTTPASPPILYPAIRSPGSAAPLRVVLEFHHVIRLIRAAQQMRLRPATHSTHLFDRQRHPAPMLTANKPTSQENYCQTGNVPQRCTATSIREPCFELAHAPTLRSVRQSSKR